MVTSLPLKYVPYTYKDPLGSISCNLEQAGALQAKRAEVGRRVDNQNYDVYRFLLWEFPTIVGSTIVGSYLGVLVRRVPLFGVCIRALDLGKLPY